MDPMIDFVRDRTTDLRRLADGVRRERDVRKADTIAASTDLVVASRPEPAGRPTLVESCPPPCDPARPEASTPRAA